VTLEGESRTPAGTVFLYPRKKRTKLHYKSWGPSTDWVFLRFQWRPSWMLRKKSFVESIWHAVGTGHGAMLHTSASPAASCFLSLPSNEAQAGLLLLNGTWTRIVTCSGNIRGRNDKECGQIGVNRIPGTCNYRKYIKFVISITHIKVIAIILMWTIKEYIHFQMKTTTLFIEKDSVNFIHVHSMGATSQCLLVYKLMYWTHSLIMDFPFVLQISKVMSLRMGEKQANLF
jgi:hypothetical protein